MNYRAAVLEDVEELMPIMMDGAAKVGEPSYQVRFDPQDVRSVLENTIINGVVIRGDASVAGAVLFPFLWNTDFLDGHILFWHFMSNKEIMILDHMVALLRGLGCHRVHATSHFPENTILKRYQGLGFSPREVISTVNL